jgi:hypothetical protein
LFSQKEQQIQNYGKEWRKMSKGFDINFEGLDMSQEGVQELVKKYKKIKKYQKSSLFAVKTMDGTEEIVSKMVEEAREGGF